ncbi:MAG: membrane protein insertase YidC [Pseudomonadota bacterium]
MPNTRLFLLIAIFACAFLMYQQWQLDYAPPPPPPAGSTAQTATDIPETGAAAVDALVPGDVPTAPSAVDADVPAVVSQPAVAPAEAESTGPESGQLIRVTTDVLDVDLNVIGGQVQRALLLEYPLKLKTPELKVTLLNTDPLSRFVAQSGLVSNSHASPDHRQRYTAERTEYVLEDGQEELIVPLTWEQDGITVVKTFRFQRGQYAVAVDHAVSNESATAWVGSDYRQMIRRRPPEPEGSGFTNPERYSFLGAGLYTADNKYEKIDFEDLDSRAVARDGTTSWVAMVQHYFVTAWVPPAEQRAQLEAQAVSVQNQQYRVRSVSPAIRVAPGENGYFTGTLFVGPKLHDQIEPLAEGLVLTVDYGIFTPFSKILYWLLDKIHSLTGNWGWAIVLLTVLVKAAFYKLSEAQYRSTAKLRKLQPRIQQLKERYGDDRQKFNVAMMEIYKKEKVNPLGGCLPILVQIPVFFALYWVLLESVELRQADFMLWINDLSSPDPLFILPVINGAAMFMTTKLSPNPAADPIQQRIFLAMPIVFSVMFAFFQAGLVLYWTVNAVLSLAQQWFITKRIDAAG